MKWQEIPNKFKIDKLRTLLMASLFLRIEVKTTLVPPVAHGTHFKIGKKTVCCGYKSLRAFSTYVVNIQTVYIHTRVYSYAHIYTYLHTSVCSEWCWVWIDTSRFWTWEIRIQKWNLYQILEVHYQIGNNIGLFSLWKRSLKISLL